MSTETLGDDAAQNAGASDSIVADAMPATTTMSSETVDVESTTPPVAPVATPSPPTGKGYRLDSFLPLEQAQYLESLAAHYGHSLPEFVARLIIIEESVKEIECIKCKHRQRQIGVYPDVPWRPAGDSYETKLCVRLLGNRWVEIKVPGGIESKYMCSICVTTNLMGVKLALRMLMQAFPGFTIDNDFLDDLFKGAVPTHKALGSGQKALPAPKRK